MGALGLSRWVVLLCASVCILVFVQDDADWLEAALVGNEDKLPHASPWVLRLRMSPLVMHGKEIRFAEIVRLVGVSRADVGL